MRVSPTQRQIAEKVGVSQATVAMVLGAGARVNARRIGEATQKKIIQTATQMGYRPHRQAQILRGTRSGMIGVIAPVSATMTSAQNNYHVASAVERSGYSLYLQSTAWQANSLQRLVQNALDARVEGLLLLHSAGELPGDILQLINRSGVPTVNMAENVAPGIPKVQPDYNQGVRLLVEHALRLGHRNFLYEMKDEVTVSGNCLPCFLACKDLMEAAGATYRVFRNKKPRQLFDYHESGHELAASILADRDNLPDIVFCHNDQTALPAQIALFKAGLRIPEDIAMVGFDNDPFCRYLPSPLTTVSHPQAEVANKAMEILLAMIRGEKSPPPLETRFTCKLVVRESCGAALSKTAATSQSDSSENT